jgi:transcriptional regulator with XRE-family HTH domain
MNRSEFGRLVSALRKEHIDEEMNFWTQKKLGEETGLGELIIGKIERGQRANLDGDTLLRLANALRLTSGERREFFLAASGISEEKIPRQHSDPRSTLDELIQMMRQIQSPAFIMDVYCDMLAVNTAIWRLFNPNLTNSGGMVAQPTGFNIMRDVFSLERELRSKVMGQHWDSIARRNLMHFRESTLQYRSTPYFRYLLGDLLSLPQFRRYWNEVQFTKDDHFLSGDWIWFESPEWGALKYLVTTVVALTTYGKLELCVYVPASPNTATATNRIIKPPGLTVHRLAPWPEKPIP